MKEITHMGLRTQQLKTWKKENDNDRVTMIIEIRWLTRIIIKILGFTIAAAAAAAAATATATAAAAAAI